MGRSISKSSKQARNTKKHACNPGHSTPRTVEETLENLEAQEQKIRDLLAVQEKMEKTSKTAVKTVRLLGSAPEHNKEHTQEVLTKAKDLIEKAGGFNLGGDAKDRFHTKLLSREQMTQEMKGWRAAWLGKCATGIDMAMRCFPGATIIVYTIDGGPECQWELQEIQGPIQRQFPSMQVMRCKDFMEFQAHLSLPTEPEDAGRQASSSSSR